ncbi:MAG: 50S ribosomal protein L9 [Acholeplasmatales bacterium]|jgi:ribosomal protein L9|nr:50S ribosomal protein L9 [Acholeplasmatales bacterium]
MKRLILFILSILFYTGLCILVILDPFDIKELVEEIILIVASILFAFSFKYYFTYRSRIMAKTLENRMGSLTRLSYHVNQVGNEIFNELPIGIFSIGENGIVKWSNLYSKNIFEERIIDKKLSELSPDLVQMREKKISSMVVKIKNDYYDASYKEEFDFFYLFYETNRENLRNEYFSHHPVVGYISFDGLDDALSGLDLKNQSELRGSYFEAVADYLENHNAFIKNYTTDKVMFMCYRFNLKKMIDEHFSILESVRKISVENRKRISLSIGTACWNTTFSELGVLAQGALDLAEKRGGDQVVINIQGEKIRYLGGTLEANIKKSKVDFRQSADELKDLIKSSDKVLIMGHIEADLDALGAMIIVHHIAKLDNENVRIVIQDDLVEDSALASIEKLKQNETPVVKDFISIEKALESLTEKSLLIVVDTQSPKIVMDRNIYQKANKLFVIDHHRIGEEGFKTNYIINEPSASCSVEILIELIDFYKKGSKNIVFNATEANVLYAGMLIDTNHFTQRISFDTFETANKLLDMGADPITVKMWLRRPLEKTIKFNKFLDKVSIYLNKFAIISSNEIITDRSFIAQIADEALQISDVEASFVIMRLDESQVAVSARSYRDVNVQMIMESMGGGGHFNMAAAQIKDKTVKVVTQEVKDYLQLEFGGSEVMKIILLEDVKGRGSKDDIIDVNAGFGNFLISKGSATQATNEAIHKVEQAREEKRIADENHLSLLKILKDSIDGKMIEIPIQIGTDGKLFGRVTTKQIVDVFAATHKIVLDKKKVEIVGEINALGVYTVLVDLHKDVKAQFEVSVIGKVN